MKKTIYSVLSGLFMLAAVAVATSCDSKETKAEANESEVAEESVQKDLKIAYVLIDTLTNQYQKCKDLEEVFTKKKANAENTINEKGKNFANQVQEFQRKVQSNSITQQQYESEQARLQKLQQDIEALQARLSTSLEEEYSKEFQALTDTIKNFVQSYAEEKGYDFILCKSSGIDNVLYAAPQYDVTEEVVSVLNKRYNKAAKAEKKDKEEKEK